LIFRTIIKPSLILTGVVFASSFALSHIYKITEPSITRQKAEKEKEALLIVLPDFAIGEEKTDIRDDSVFHYWVGEKKNEDTTVSVAYAFITESQGYSGEIRSMIGIGADGHIIGIYIIEQTETPGLGARAVEGSASSTIWGSLRKMINGEEIEPDGYPWFQRQFVGLNAKQEIHIEKIGDWTPEKEQALLDRNAITAITGATITGRAVIKSIEQGCERLSSILEKELEKEKELEVR